MGGGSWSPSSWSSYATATYSSAPVGSAAMYTSRKLKDEFNPLKFKGLRESKDSIDHPFSTPIIIGLDVSGSMDSVLDAMARNLGTLVENIYDRKPVTDPQICYMAIGDVESDEAPVQMTQFESDIRIAEQMNGVFVERGGGGNAYESYIAAWYMAAYKTDIDCFEKRGKKGILFTMGDEGVTKILTASDIREFIDADYRGQDITPETLYAEVSKKWDVFHLIIGEGSHCRGHKDSVVKQWKDILHQRALYVSDYTKVPAIITSCLQVLAGENVKSVIDSWDGTTSLAVSTALGGVMTNGTLIVENDVVTFK